jgi:hypothetical protein
METYFLEIKEGSGDVAMKKAVIQFAVVGFLMYAATASAQNVSTGVSITSGHTVSLLRSEIITVYPNPGSCT